MITRNRLLFSAYSVFLLVMLSCSTMGGLDPASKKFLAEVPKDEEEIRETFRVLITSEKYIVVQTKHDKTIRREPDPGGDSYICDEIKKLNKIDEAREGVIYIWLYPHSGKLMKVRSYKLFNLLELDQLIIDDIQRWSFQFPQYSISPNKLYIKYRIVLKKQQSDKEIIQELQKKMMDEKK